MKCMHTKSQGSNMKNQRVGVGAVYFVGGKVLLVHKVKAMDTVGGPTEIAGQWGFPMGGIARGEDPKVALNRELWEETGVTNVKSASELPPLEFKFPDFYRKNTGFESQYTYMFLVEGHDEASFHAQCEEIDEVKAFSPVEALQTISHQKNREYLREVLRSKGVIEVE